MIRRTTTIRPWAMALALCFSPCETGAAQQPSRDDRLSTETRDFLSHSCFDCHDSQLPAARLDLKSLASQAVEGNTDAWEKVVRKLRARQMPPEDAPHPTESAYIAVVSSLEATLDRIAAAHPRPGRTDTFRRLTRTEYQNVIRDLLAVEIDATAMLPSDEASHGFDNITVRDLSPTLVNRYISAAQTISRLAIGGSQKSPGGDTFRIRPDVTQDSHVAGLPFGTRGGAVVPYHFPQDGEYEFQIRLARDRDEHVEGLSGVHELELLLDLQNVASFKVRPPKSKSASPDEYGGPTHESVDRHLRTRIKVTAGQHDVGVTFLKEPASLLETSRQPLNVHFNMYRHPRIGPAVYQISIAGPFDATGPGESVSRRRIFVRQPATTDQEDDCATEIISGLLRRACRQPIDDKDLAAPMAVYREARMAGGFENAIEMAVSSVLVNPKFLFRIERDPPGISPGTTYRISDIELASRLSFFLWSSIPDDELLQLAEEGRLSSPDVLEHQTRRMLADARSRSLVTNFAGQWLHLRNLDSTTPDARLYPDFDDNLRQSLRQETELFFESIMRDDRSVLDLLKTDYTFLNERLAKHYGIPHVYGSPFRRVELPPDSVRGGLLRQGSILTVTSYATRTSPVIRGKWILDNIIGTPPPPPPDDVPALKDNTVAANLSVRERLAQHRADPACASCHDVIDPVGFSLENFDAVGRWRDMEEGRPVDASGGLSGGVRFTGVSGLEQGLLDRPELFVGTMAEKLMTYAIGRGIEPSDAPAIRRIVREAKSNGFRFSSLILAVVNSQPFQMRESR